MKMRTLIALLMPATVALLMSATFAPPAASAGPAAADFDEEAAAVKCREAAKRLGSNLKTELMAAMKEGGPLAAVDVCSEMAPAIADTLAAETGLDVCRTAVKWRNPHNEPDAWETAVLNSFTKRVEAGEKPGDMEFGEIVADPENGRSYRWMKGIGTVGLCLKCHGSDLDPELAGRIAELYPWDKAVGFAAGDLRGAFSVSMPLDRTLGPPSSPRLEYLPDRGN